MAKHSGTKPGSTETDHAASRLILVMLFAIGSIALVRIGLAAMRTYSFEVTEDIVAGGGAFEIDDPAASNNSYTLFKSQSNVEKFTLLPPGSQLPSGEECAQRVRRHGWEHDQANTKANNTVGKQLIDSYIGEFNKAIESRVNGNFTGTTDEIIQWGACKWGFDEDDIRAQAVTESTWRQYRQGDCGRGTDTQFGFDGCESVGLLQVQGANIPPTHKATWPEALDSTAFNVDYTLGVRRLCYEGHEVWLGNGYAAGDLWGCIGRWFSGDWYIGSQNYIAEVQGHLRDKPWIDWGYPGP